MRSLSLYWNTIRYLRPVQVYGRAKRAFTRSHIATNDLPAVRQDRTGVWAPPACRRPSMVGPLRFDFLNEQHDIARTGWDDPALSKLWRYNLHYFDDLNAAGHEARSSWHEALLERWVEANAIGVGTGWEPYPTSLRVVNWIKWTLGGAQLTASARESLALQARWLCGRLETHLLGNHLLANAKALVFAGLFFEGEEAAAWLRCGLDVLGEQVPEQVLPDGGQFELSPMYHALALEDIVDLCNIAREYDGLSSALRAAATEWQLVVPSMQRWLTAMCHPDGQISFFNDAAMGIAPSPNELTRYAERIGVASRDLLTEGITHLPDSGYVRIERGPIVALLDVARVGPDYLPGHAHADTLSFELSAFGERIFVNAGTSVYGSGAERLRQRGTAAHNTVIVDGADSSEVWAGFRVARRALPIGLHVENGAEAVVRCGHTGYERLGGRPRHTREWRVSSDAMMITDSLSSRVRTAEARFHLHPSVGVERLDPMTVALRAGDGRLVFQVECGKLDLVRDSWHPEFGASEPTWCLVAPLEAGALRATLHWGSL